MTPADIRAAIAIDQSLQALALVRSDDGAIAAALSSGRMRSRFYLVTERTVVSVLGVIAGEQFLQALESFAVATLAAEHPLAAYQSGIARQLAWLKRDGLDVGNEAARSMMDALVSAGTLNADSVSTIKALGVEPDPVSVYDVIKALEGQ